jgi:hypothetical protein
MKYPVLGIAALACLLHSSIAAPRLSVADAPHEISCGAHVQPPFIALVDVLGIDPSEVAVHAALGATLSFIFQLCLLVFAPAADADGSSLLIRSFIAPAPDLEVVLSVCAFGPRIISLRLQLATLSCMTSRADLCRSRDLVLHELSLSVVISWSAPDWSSFSASKYMPFAQIHSRMQAAPPPPSWPLPFAFTLQPGSPPPSLFKRRPVVVFVFGGDIDWLHIDTSLLLALSAPAKNIIFLKEMAAPAAADVVLFSCRCTRTRPRTRAA